MKKFIKLSLAAIIVMGAMTASAKEIKVGSLGGLTGPLAEMIEPIIISRKLAETHVNAQGGLLNGDTLKMVIADSACDPKAAVDAGNKVINIEQVVAIVGPNCSGATSGLAQAVSIPAGVVSLSDSASSPSITDLKDNDLVFRIVPSDAYQGAALASYVLNSGVKKLAMTYANDDYNAGLAAVFEREYKSKGGTITAVQVHEPSKASYRSEIATLARGNPEVLALFAYYGSSGITIIRNSLENGLFSRFYSADGMFNNAVIEQIGADTLRGNMSIMQLTSDYNSQSYIIFESLFTNESDADPKSIFVTNGYDATFLIALAIEKAGSADRSKISSALRLVANAPGEVIRPGEWKKAKGLIAAGKDINYQGASGDIEFDKNGDVAGVYGINIIGDSGKWTQSQIMK